MSGRVVGEQRLPEISLASVIVKLAGFIKRSAFRSW